MPDDVIAKFGNFSYKYPGSSSYSLRNVNLQFKRGKITLVAGPTGAGKTTLCSCLNGLIPHFYRGEMQGEVTVEGTNTASSSVSYLSTKAGLLFQDPASQLICATVEDELAFGPENLGLPVPEINQRIVESLEYVRLSDYRSTPPYALSGGQQQSCALASILTISPSLYVLDEPTSNLDPIGTDLVFDLLNKLKAEHEKTIIIVEHKLDDLLPIVDEVVVLQKGQVAHAGTPREIFTEQAESLQEMGLRPPIVPLISQKIADSVKFDRIPFTFEEALQALSKLPRRPFREPSSDIHASQAQSSSDTGNQAISADNVFFTYPTGTIALKGVTLRVGKGEFLALMGQNGSGKTTLAKTFNGLLRPSKGSVLVNGMDTKTTPMRELIREVGYVFQNPDRQLFCSSVRDEIKYTLKNVRVPRDEMDQRVEDIAKRLRIDHFLGERPFELSKGDRQRVALASVLALDPKVLVIDEPTTGQDPQGRKDVMDLLNNLNREGKTIVVITHDMELAAEYARRAVILNKGEILLDSSVRDVFRQTDLLKSAYLKPPRITEFFQFLRKNNLPVKGDVLTEAEGIEVMVKAFGR